MNKFIQRQDKIDSEEAGGILKVGTLRDLGPLLILGISTLTFWISMWIFGKGQSLMIQVILKFIVYLSVILWLNSALYLRELALGTDVDTFKFQKKQVKFTLWIFFCFILTEIPTWISFSQSH